MCSSAVTGAASVHTGLVNSSLPAVGQEFISSSQPHYYVGLKVMLEKASSVWVLNATLLESTVTSYTTLLICLLKGVKQKQQVSRTAAVALLRLCLHMTRSSTALSVGCLCFDSTQCTIAVFTRLKQKTIDLRCKNMQLR